ncbi:hypothetical protein V5O48_006589 [Marasmius crinis-equi]|uniref:ABC transporter domain-containing protein n=1 Tax=Marasmius crinis-equi TaxID=585013 RepID=A0ABR3FJ49_9AGAR
MSKPKKTTESTITDEDTPLEEIQLGVYRLYLEKKKFRKFEFTRSRVFAVWDKWLKTYQVIVRLSREIVPLVPGLLVLSILLSVWEGFQSVILGTLEGRILHIIEHGISTRSLDSKALVMTLIARLACMSLQVGITRVWSHRIDTLLQNRIKNHFDQLIFTAKLRMDLPTVQDNISFDHLSPSLGYYMVERMFSLLSQIIGGVGHLGLIFFTARRGSTGNHGVTFALLCILRPILSGMGGFSIFTTPRVIEANNPHYLRTLSLKELVDSKYRLDIISGNIVEYIIDQYKTAKSALGNDFSQFPEYDYMLSSRARGVRAILLTIVGELPMLYFVATAILDPSEVSLAALATVQASSRSAQSAYWQGIYMLRRLAADSASVRQIFDIQSMKKVVKDEGQLSYPPEHGSEKGMSFELRNVTFKYPGSKNTTNALDSVSLRIGAGELVVVVGANGSGKSTFVNILSRLYDPSSGQVLVDDVDIKEYKLSEIRRAIATLTQDHHLYPLSLRENIGLGSIDDMANNVMITEAARKGGAEQLIAKLDDGLDTVLNPQTRQYGALVDEGGDSPLARKLKELKKTSNVSGGERQRLVASRTFMRFNSDRVKFVAADEPTAALDPEGELALFTQLRQERKGKTMFFITHRFGPLVKYADRIICMKDGKIVESGDHATLMALKGEYCKMWSIQAKSFES